MDAADAGGLSTEDAGSGGLAIDVESVVAVDYDCAGVAQQPDVDVDGAVRGGQFGFASGVLYGLDRLSVGDADAGGADGRLNNQVIMCNEGFDD